MFTRDAGTPRVLLQGAFAGMTPTSYFIAPDQLWLNT
jgi:hypothetical protein